MILGGGVAVCLLLSAHRAVIFAIAKLYFIWFQLSSIFLTADDRSPDICCVIMHTVYMCITVTHSWIIGFGDCSLYSVESVHILSS